VMFCAPNGKILTEKSEKSQNLVRRVRGPFVSFASKLAKFLELPEASGKQSSQSPAQAVRNTDVAGASSGGGAHNRS